jgi:hypothetical protein
VAEYLNDIDNQSWSLVNVFSEIRVRGNSQEGNSHMKIRNTQKEGEIFENVVESLFKTVFADGF